MTCPKVWPKLSATRRPFVSQGSRFTSASFSRRETRISSASSGGRRHQARKVGALSVTAIFHASSRPSRRCASVSVPKSSSHSQLSSAKWKTPSTFFAPPTFTAPLPPTLESTAANSVLGTWMKRRTPRLKVCAKTQATSPTVPPPMASSVTARGEVRAFVVSRSTVRSDFADSPARSGNTVAPAAASARPTCRWSRSTRASTMASTGPARRAAASTSKRSEKSTTGL